MSRFKLIAFIALITLAFSIALVGDAVAGEKWKGRTTKYCVKWEPISVADQEGHVIAVCEYKHITSQIEARGFSEPAVGWEADLLDINMKTGQGEGHGYGEVTWKDGSKGFYRWKGKPVEPGHWEVDVTYTGGTGRFEGIQGKGRSSGHTLGPNQACSDWEMEVELPGR